jgi:hypothetical protein
MAMGKAFTEPGAVSPAQVVADYRWDPTPCTKLVGTVRARFCLPSVRSRRGTEVGSGPGCCDLPGPTADRADRHNFGPRIRWSVDNGPRDGPVPWGESSQKDPATRAVAGASRLPTDPCANSATSDPGSQTPVWEPLRETLIRPL